MLVVDVNRENFEYDVHAIVQAFYPEEQVKVLTPETGEEKRSLLQEKIRFRIREERDSVLCTLDDREYCWKAAGEKEGFKRFLYLTLSQMTGRTLPWGNLTGIRPTKIAYGMLDQGKSEEEIVDFYRHASGRYSPWGKNAGGFRLGMQRSCGRLQSLYRDSFLSHYLPVLLFYFFSRERIPEEGG